MQAERQEHMSLFTPEIITALIVGIAFGIYFENRDGRYSLTLAARRAWDNLMGRFEEE